MDVLDRHYTESIFSELLINCINYHKPESIIDLGIGNGSLTIAAYGRWKNASFWGCDIDQDKIEDTRSKLPFAEISIIDGLDVSKKFPFRFGSVDIAVCNPPYFRISEPEKYKYEGLFNSANLGIINSLSYITADLVFLAHNLRLLKKGGQLGIILPDGIITNHAFQPLRKMLLEKYTVKSVVELPAKIFKKTEAKTHIIIIEKSKNIDYDVELFGSDISGVCTDKLVLNSAILAERMDYTYLNWVYNVRTTANKSLRSINAEIIRSSATTKKLKSLNTPFLHSTTYRSGDILNLDDTTDKNENLVYAKSGDIVVTRVGKRCIGKTCLLKTGKIYISDCVFIIRVSEKYRYLVLHALLSNYGKQWFQATGHGVCSQVISKEDLYRFCF